MAAKDTALIHALRSGYLIPVSSVAREDSAVWVQDDGDSGKPAWTHCDCVSPRQWAVSQKVVAALIKDGKLELVDDRLVPTAKAP